MRKVQDAISPVWTIALDGCKFVESWKDLDALRASGGYEVEYRKFEMPLPPLVALAKPHLIGTAVKLPATLAAADAQ